MTRGRITPAPRTTVLCPLALGWPPVLPRLVPAILTGFALAFARAVGEYGSVIFISSNIPNKTEIAPLLIIIRLEEFDVPAAAVIATVMLLISFAMLLVINLIQAWARRLYGAL